MKKVQEEKERQHRFNQLEKENEQLHQALDRCRHNDSQLETLSLINDLNEENDLKQVFAEDKSKCWGLVKKKTLRREK